MKNKRYKMNLIKIDEKNNRILNYEPQLINSEIIFHGKNNVLICEESVVLNGSNINFFGDNSIIYLSSNYNHYKLLVNIFNNSVLFIDENNYFSSLLYLLFSEEKSIYIGKDSLFSQGVGVRLADAHLIYDVDSMKRINLSEDVYFGDHIWIGQEALILKGTNVGSGSIIGARAVVSNKKIKSNSIVAGVPSKEIKRNIFFDGRSVHNFTKNETEQLMEYSSDKWIYSNENAGSGFDKIEEINKINDIDLKIEKIIELRNDKSKNRFYI